MGTLIPIPAGADTNTFDNISPFVSDQRATMASLGLVIRRLGGTPPEFHNVSEMLRVASALAEGVVVRDFTRTFLQQLRRLPDIGVVMNFQIDGDAAQVVAHVANELNDRNPRGSPDAAADLVAELRRRLLQRDNPRLRTETGVWDVPGSGSLKWALTFEEFNTAQNHQSKAALYAFAVEVDH